jgi:CIC family chloride channel protein
MREGRNLLSKINKLLLSRSTGKWIVVGIFIGIIAGFGALALYFSIKLVTEYLLVSLTGFNPPVSGVSGGVPNYVIGHYRMILIPVSLVIGGLISGFIVYRFAPEAEGHGTDAAIKAFHENNGKIRRRIPVVKMVASAVTIGSGGSAGREGPTAQIAAGFGSFIADAFKMSDRDRRIAMAAGIGAGIGSIFMAPLGGALLSTEILYRQDFEVEALIPAIIASVVGYSIFAYPFHYVPLFTIPQNTILGFSHPEALVVYLLVGVLAGLGGILYVRVFYGVQKLFSRMKRVSKYFRPAIGALIVGIIAMFFPEVLGLGYGWVQQIFYNNLVLLPLYLLIILFFLKIVATSFTIGSGGSGGVFAPGIVTGAFMGAAIGIVIHPYFPFLDVTEITIVCMIAFFGGVSKAPISVLIMGTEMTGGFALFLPLMLSTTVAYFVSGMKNSIYSAQVKDRAASPAHRLEYDRPIMDDVLVSDAMRSDYPFVRPEQTLKEAIEAIRGSKTKSVVVRKNGKLEGLLSLEEIPGNVDYSSSLVQNYMNANPETISPKENIHNALDILTRVPSGKLIVVDENKEIMGTVGFAEIADAYNREIRRLKKLKATQ